MAYTAYTTHDLLQMVRVLRDPDPFWLSNFFRQQINFETRYIDFDVVDEGKKLAPFVAPTVQGRVIESQGFTTKRFTPAYIKPKGVVEPDKLFTRRAGEAYTGSLTPAQRRDATVAAMVRDYRNRIVRRWEWMAAQAVQYGQVTISGEDYPTTVVNFNRHADLTVVLTGTDLWTNSASTPIKDIEDMVRTMRQLSGYGTRSLIMGTAAWDAFIAHQSIKDLLESRRGSLSQAETGPGEGTVFEKKGVFGAYTVYVYSDKYQNDAGVETDYLDPRDVIGISAEGFQGVRCFGAILDKQAGYQALDIFTKMWENEDPSVEYLLMQSAPLMVPKQPNASFRLRVAT